MRPFFLPFFVGHSLLRYSNLDLVVHAHKVPFIEHPICRRNFTCTAPSPNVPTVMLVPDVQCKRDAEQTTEAMETEAETLADGASRDEAVRSETQVEASTASKGDKLPKLSSRDFQIYNSMAEHMDYFHNHFRQTWNMLYGACTNNKRPSSMSLKQFISAGLQFCSHLTAHHSIEERYVFPMLASKMPEFKAGPNTAELLRQHKEIHQGLDVFEEYLKKCRNGETELDLRTLKLKMDTWGEVLWKHLDQEVKTLGAENMRKYWTLEEMRRMPI